MKEQRLREFIKKFIKEMVDEASRSTVKVGSEKKYQDKFGRNVTAYTAVSKKGRETPMISYDDNSQIKTDFDWSSLRGIRDYHYEGKQTDVYVYNDNIIIDYRKENKLYAFPPTLFVRPKKGAEGMNTIESTHKADGGGDPEKSNFSEETTLVVIPKNKWLLIRSKWEDRDSSKTKDFQKIRSRRSSGSGILKGKDKKAIFKGGSDKEGYFDLGGTFRKAMAAKRGSQFSG
tara:strand:+ start:758 stop:1450 length:693 start_codon:yes stop_codon:yes gene_type:complete